MTRVLSEHWPGRVRQPDGRLPATYEVIYAHAWGPEPGQPRRSKGMDIATFPVDQLRIRKKGG